MCVCGSGIGRYGILFCCTLLILRPWSPLLSGPTLFFKLSTLLGIPLLLGGEPLFCTPGTGLYLLGPLSLTGLWWVTHSAIEVYLVLLMSPLYVVGSSLVCCLSLLSDRCTTPPPCLAFLLDVCAPSGDMLTFFWLGIVVLLDCGTSPGWLRGGECCMEPVEHVIFTTTGMYISAAQRRTLGLGPR